MTMIVKIPGVTQPTPVEKFGECGDNYCRVEPGHDIALAAGESLMVDGIKLKYVGRSGDDGKGAPVVEFGEPEY